ncbi:Uncharacterised protein [uncultured archaeon]|nr:Uncharacterised protein [uncultured archaeon]
MDMRIFAAVMAVGLLGLVAFAGVGYAAGFWGNFHGQNMNATRNVSAPFNATVVQDFRQAVASGNYAEAKQLHDTYGIGGKLFDKMNETTFAKFSQIYGLEASLRQDLGLNETNRPHGGLFGLGYKAGFANGMMHRRG